MKKLLAISCLWLMGLAIFAQSTITGKVTAKEDGLPLPGVNIVVKGTTTGTITDFDGNYSLKAESSDVLVFSFVGYSPQEISVGTSTVINVSLVSESIGLDELVVTALGIKKNQKALTYSTQQLKGDELTKAKDANLVNSMAGKSAGVQITKSSSGVGGSAKIVIRGNRSASGNNQPLYVIDGVPMLNSISVQPASTHGGNNDAGGRDSGDGISNLNPDDIESINILKGASAAALYGSQAANGVIVVTTKKGKAGATKIDVSSNITFDNVTELPELQNDYGKLGDNSWGSKLAKAGNRDYIDDFFQTGFTAINSISVSKGNDQMQTYFSYANTSANGIIERNRLNKHNVNFRQTAQLFNNKLQLDANVNLVRQTVRNRPTPGGFYMNPLVGLYNVPGGFDIDPYISGFEKFDAGRNISTQQWHKATSPEEQNPWWLIYRAPSWETRNRIISALSAKWDVTDWFSLQARGNVDYTNDNYEQHMFASTDASLAGTANGRFITDNGQETQIYGDVIASANKKWDVWSISASVGTSINEFKSHQLMLDSRPAGLFLPNGFSVGNMTSLGYIEESDIRKQLQSVFGTAQIGLKDFLFLDVTARNDWSSSLAYTKNDSKGFFYPSVGLTAVISDMATMPSFISFGKVRGSYSNVGNDLPAGITFRQHTFTAGANFQENSSAPFGDLKPEISSSMEFGTDWRFFNSRLSIELTYYKTETKNQFFSIPAPAASGYSNFLINAGKIENKGFEAMVGITPISNDNFTWKSDFNFATNKNKVLELHKDLPEFIFGSIGNNSYYMKLVEGGSFGDIYGKTFKRGANGKVEMDADGLPVGSGKFEKVANVAPDFKLSWNNSLQYKNWSMSFLIDGGFGGEVMSLTEAELDKNGVSKASGSARNAGYVMFEGNKINNVEGFFKRVGGRDGISEYYVYDATNIRLREFVLAYSLPKSLVQKTGFLSGANVSFVGRNLFFFKNDAPFDPDNSLSTGNNLQGIDMYGMPSTRSLGFNVKLSF
jgi:TonB-linked SusC/RagA family outer membrane protein